MYQPHNYHSIHESIPDDTEIVGLAGTVYAQVFRTDFAMPGFALVSFRQEVESIVLRRFMVALKRALDVIYRQKRGQHLAYRSMLWFDQQTTTKFHLDGGPDESYLLLGYEPSRVESMLCMADYTHAAHDLNLTPQQFLTDYNPQSGRGGQELARYMTCLEVFDAHDSHVLLVNNSRLPFSPDIANTLGVMHQATILNPNPIHSRIVNSIMLTV
jgi:hypothetical protein